MMNQATASTQVIAGVLDRVSFQADGLAPAIVQDHETGRVLMLAWMNREALRRTLTEGRVTFWSRSRQEYWRKGDTSGHAQFVQEVALDCDADTVLVRVRQVGAACHTGSFSCFDDRLVDAVVLPQPAPPLPAAPAFTPAATSPKGH